MHWLDLKTKFCTNCSQIIFWRDYELIMLIARVMSFYLDGFYFQYECWSWSIFEMRIFGWLVSMEELALKDVLDARFYYDEIRKLDEYYSFYSQIFHHCFALHALMPYHHRPIPEWTMSDGLGYVVLVPPVYQIIMSLPFRSYFKLYFLARRVWNEMFAYLHER